MSKNNDTRIAFFGSPDFAVTVLDELENLDIVPDLVVAQPDKPAGRKLILTPPETKVWAEERNISTFQPESLKDPEVVEALESEGPWDIFIVASYGKIIPKRVLDIPKHGTLNVHPSLLPKHRGASPIQQALLDDDSTGVTIMLMDEELDHGPILAVEDTVTTSWPVPAEELRDITAKQGARMIAELLPDFLSGNMTPEAQNHEAATYTKKIVKADGELDLGRDALANYRKICAYDQWPRTFFFHTREDKQIRVIITKAHIENGELVIDRVIPEGKSEIDYTALI